jgi:hypothetical protein
MGGDDFHEGLSPILVDKLGLRKSLVCVKALA